MSESAETKLQALVPALREFMEVKLLENKLAVQEQMQQICSKLLTKEDLSNALGSALINTGHSLISGNSVPAAPLANPLASVPDSIDPDPVICPDLDYNFAICESFEQMWIEYSSGINGKKSLKEINKLYGTKWRSGTRKSKIWSRQGIFYRFVEGMLLNGHTTVVQDLDNERNSRCNKTTFNFIEKVLKTRPVLPPESHGTASFSSSSSS